MAISRADLRRYKAELSIILKRLRDRLETTCRVFNTNRKEPARGKDEGEGLARDKVIFRWISEGLRDQIADHDIAELLRLRSVLAFIKGIRAPMQKLRGTVHQKIDEHLLFSDRAVREINDLFRKSGFVMDACGDAVLTENPILKAHVICGVDYIFDLIESYADEHQQRLISGVCRPRPSVLYLDMNESFRTMLHRIKEIALHIPAEVEVETWVCPPRPASEERPK